MGIAWLLLRRTFTAKPKRTLLFILGYALSAAVMITLLSVGEAVLAQAQNKDLLGGGNVILVPQGVDIETLKTGGLSALYYSIPQSRFLIRQLLQSSRFAEDIQIISPYIIGEPLYAKKDGKAPQLVFADGSIPEQESRIKRMPLPWRNLPSDDEWYHPDPSRFYHEIDRFHLPSGKSKNLDRWAEWHYFNFHTGEFFGYLSVMAAGDVTRDNAQWIVSLQISDNSYRRYSYTIPLRAKDLPLERVDYNAGTNSIRYDGTAYEISLNFNDREQIRGTLRYHPDPRLYFPPTILAQTDELESGYVIPALRGKYTGSLTIGNRTYDFNNVEGYHDHNWGIWQRTEWNWGQAFGKEHSIFFGEIYLNEKSKGLFLAVYDRKGFLSIFRPDEIQFSGIEAIDGIRTPTELTMSVQKQFASISVKGRALSRIATPVELISPSYFIQSNNIYDIVLELDGHRESFTAKGNSETFVRR